MKKIGFIIIMVSMIALFVGTVFSEMLYIYSPWPGRGIKIHTGFVHYRYVRSKFSGTKYLSEEGISGYDILVRIGSSPYEPEESQLPEIIAIGEPHIEELSEENMDKVSYRTISSGKTVPHILESISEFPDDKKSSYRTISSGKVGSHILESISEFPDDWRSSYRTISSGKVGSQIVEYVSNIF